MGDQIVTAQSAQGTSQASTAVISSRAKQTQFTTVTGAANSCVLPLGPILNADYTITNKGAFPLFVWPAAGSTSSATATMDGVAVAAGPPAVGAAVVPVNGSATFVCTALNPLTGHTWLSKTEAIRGVVGSDAANTIPAAPGKCYVAVPAVAANRVYTVSSNTSQACEYNFVVTAVTGGTVTLAFGAGRIRGVTGFSADGTAPTVNGGVASVIIANGAAANDTVKATGAAGGYQVQCFVAVNTDVTTA